ncbi:JAB domain-containing protein [Pedobacter insulae]|uniref:RadC-like JAB domain-containing protein n=1 Tax=Pedobacter insulae TaxID=414048 RepID=A0A1I2ZJN9_9SPHI|nr:JAB domain-containing protein [Pedobacter insulae]SFH37331.1 RadC-like JAB domain-containing protein [Pedobacter insulae]
MEALKNFQVAEIELSYKSKVAAKDRPVANRSSACYELLLKNWDMDKIELVEQSKVILLNRANHVLGIFDLSTGGTCGTVIDIKLVMIAALKMNASALVISHNHPTGNLKPSTQDILITEKLVAAGKLLTIDVNDHIIITANGYYSLADQGDM